MTYYYDPGTDWDDAPPATPEQRFMEQLLTLSERGKIAVLESGRDCDCVEFWGKVHIIDATLAAYNELHDSTAEWADGPFCFELERPSIAKRAEFVTRDLVMEAHEDGHPHAIYSRFA